jgi:hypothetical protein
MRSTRSLESIARRRAAGCRSPLCAAGSPAHPCPDERLHGRGGLFPAGRVTWIEPPPEGAPIPPELDAALDPGLDPGDVDRTSADHWCAPLAFARRETEPDPVSRPEPPRRFRRLRTQKVRSRHWFLPWLAVAVAAALAGGIVGARSAGARSSRVQHRPPPRPAPAAAPVCDLSAPLAGIP